MPSPQAADDVYADLAKEIRGMAKEMRERRLEGPSQAVTQENKTELGGFVAGISVASCVATLALMIAFMIIDNRSYSRMNDDLRDVKAWNEVLRAKVAKLEATPFQPEKK